MLAIIKTGGKQYHVKVGDVIKTEKIMCKSGDVITIDKVMAFYDAKKDTSMKIGDPYLENFQVSAEVLEQMKDKKVIVFKKKRRHNYRVKRGHRQNFTVLKITKIEGK